MDSVAGRNRRCPDKAMHEPISCMGSNAAPPIGHHPAHTKLIAADGAKSPCFTFSQIGHFPRAFSAYGFSPSGCSVTGFKGELQISTTGGYPLGNGHRTYNPSLMRFSTPDLESPFYGGGLNCYAFAVGDPINRSDPTGRMSRVSMGIGRALAQKTYRGKIITEFNGIVVFIGTPPTEGGIATLYISAHGKPGKISGDNKHLYNAARLYRQLDRDIDMRGRPTHFLSCYSHAPDHSGTSIIEDMSKLTGATSSGYKTRVSLTETRQGEEFIVHKHYARFLPGISSNKVTVGHIRAPESRNIDQ